MEYEIIDGVYKGPEAFEGSLSLFNTQITSLGNLESVGSHLDLENTPIRDLGNLVSVAGFLNLYNTPITSLGCLKSVEGDLDLHNTPIRDLGNLESVGGRIWFSANERYTGEEYQELVNNFKEIPYEDYPLYLNDERTPIRLLVNQKLKEGALWNMK